MLTALFLFATVLACSRDRGPDPRNGHGIDGHGNEFHCSGGPVPIGGLTYATTDPEGRGTCIRPPIPNP
jgi:hypothetical protein